MVATQRTRRRSFPNARTSPLLLLTVISVMFATLAGTRQDDAVFFPTYGFREGADWIIPIRVKIQKPRNSDPVGLGRLLEKIGIVDQREHRNYLARVADFVADDESGERVRIRFEGDPMREIHSIMDAAGRPLRTGSDGVLEGTVRIDAANAQEIGRAQGETNGLTFTSASDDHSGRGRARLIEAAGLSVISDIDDTIKITEVPAGKRVLARNTFCRDFVPAMELRTLYTSLEQAPFHYVSGGPWQLYRPLAAFIAQSGYPEGSFHMRVVGGSVLTASRSLEALGNFVSEDGTFRHKVEQISRIISRFPGRKFILIGDSGEQDPLVYDSIRNRYPTQVQEIVIRDVVNARQMARERLRGMTVIEAPTVVSSGFGAAR